MSQSLFQMLVHIIFATKNRYPFLKDLSIQKRMHAYIKAICVQHNCHALIVGGTDDHVHILVNLNKTMALSDLIEEIKKSSSKWIKTLNTPENILDQFYWQRGYGAFSVSQSNINQVSLYIKNQYVHHQKLNFQEEFRKFLNCHHIEYDEKYVWD